LVQARDATAALIGLAVLTGQHSSAAQRVDHVLRRDAPVQCTRRAVAADTAIGDVVLPAGAGLWIFLAAVERGTPLPATFGAGPHACPGAAHATAIARQVVSVLDAEGWQPAAGQRIDLERRPNIRSPRKVLVRTI
jgi:cytochrome P450